MTEIDKVALWAGLISSVAGIVLSIVAVVLSIVSNNRATEVNDQTIKSLQKIESAVERLSDDSRTLIKAGWDKMLGNFQQAQEPDPDLCSPDEGVGTLDVDPLVRFDEQQATPPKTAPSIDADDRFSKLESKIEDLQRKITQARRSEPSASPTQNVDRLTTLLTRLSPRAHALFDLISRSKHLEQKQFQALDRSELGLELRELLNAGLLVSLAGHGSDQDSLVYWLPTKFVRAARVATQLAPRISSELIDSVKNELKAIGYTAR